MGCQGARLRTTFTWKVPYMGRDKEFPSTTGWELLTTTSQIAPEFLPGTWKV